MRLLKVTTLIALSALLLLSLPAFADSWTVIPTPTTTVMGVPYGGSPAGCGPPACFTTDFGGGDGTGNPLPGNQLGPFTFSNQEFQNNVPNSWATWGSPPQTESSTPNVLFNAGFSTLTITSSAGQNTLGFELEPDQFQQENVTATFHSSTGASFILGLQPNGSAGALLFAIQDDTPGAFITSVDINDTAGDDFAIAQLRSGNSPTGTTPEPGTLILLGSGLLGALGVMRRKMNL